MRTLTTPFIKVYYRPIEAAIRWSGLHRFESIILKHLGDRFKPDPEDFPLWPKLHLNSERIYNAMANGDLPYGRNGITCLDPSLLINQDTTIREVDLKVWMDQFYPDERPNFIFTWSERQKLSRMAIQRILAENGSLALNLNDSVKECEHLKELNATLKQRIKELKQQVIPVREPSERSKTTYLNIIASMLNLFHGQSASGQRYSQFDSDAAIIEMIVHYHHDRPGISERTLQTHFAAARRSLKA